MYNPHGLFLAIESLGYILLDTALLFFAVLFNGRTRLEGAIRWLFIVGFILTIVSFITLFGAEYPIVVFEEVAITINVAVLIASATLLSLYFKRIPKKYPNG
jgi:hypothetical protein